MTMVYPNLNPCYNEVCYKGTVLCIFICSEFILRTIQSYSYLRLVYEKLHKWPYFQLPQILYI